VRGLFKDGHCITRLCYYLLHILLSVEVWSLETIPVYRWCLVGLASVESPDESIAHKLPLCYWVANPLHHVLWFLCF